MRIVGQKLSETGRPTRRDPVPERIASARAETRDGDRGSGLAYDGRGGRSRLAAGVCRVDGRVPEPVRDHPIMTRRSRGREVALQVLYQLEQNPGQGPDEGALFIQRRLREPMLTSRTCPCDRSSA